MAVSSMFCGNPSFGIRWWMSMAIFSSVRLLLGVFVPMAELVYIMGCLEAFLLVVDVLSCGGVNSVLPITRPQFMQTASPFSLSSSMFVLLHSGHFSFSHMLYRLCVWLFCCCFGWVVCGGLCCSVCVCFFAGCFVIF